MDEVTGSNAGDPPIMAQGLVEATGGVSGEASLVGVTGHLPKGHWGEVVVAAL